MKKQYWISKEHNFKRRVVLFHDDEPVTIFDGFEDDVEEFITDIKAQGYTKGYIPAEVKCAYLKYKELSDNIINLVDESLEEYL